MYSQKIADSWPLQYDEKAPDESLNELQKKNQPKTIATDNGVYAYEYVQVYFETISKFYNNAIDVDRIQFISQN